MTNAIGTQAIGPTFASELQAVGLVLPIPGLSWGSYGLDPLPSVLTTSQVAIIQQVYQAHDPTKVPNAPPDWTGFLKWIDATFDGPTIIAWSNAYGAFFGWAQFGNAPRVQWVLTDAKANGKVTAAQYALFQQANVTYHLGMVLP